MTAASILMVEDDHASRYIFGTVLRHHGFEVVEAITARSAFEQLEQRSFDLIVLDIGLPQVSGFDFLEALRGDPRTAHLPVIVATVHVFPEDEKRARDAGCSIFLKKPLWPHDLLAAVIAELNGAAA